MADKKAQKKRHGWQFRLNAHKAAIIVGIISLVGVLTTSVLATGGSVVVALISNWDKLRGTQTAHAAAQDTAEDLVAVNEQRRKVVEGAFNEALTYAHEAEKEAAGEDAEAIRKSVEAIKDEKAEAERHYDDMLKAMKEKKPLQADTKKTELNTTILKTQREYYRLRLYLEGKRIKLPDMGFPSAEYNRRRLAPEKKNLEAWSDRPVGS